MDYPSYKMFYDGYKEDDLLEMRIALICRRLKYSITPFQVLKWLKNFNNDETEMALGILEVVKYFDNGELFEGYKVLFSELYERVGFDKDIFIIPIGESGKSGVYMLYYVTKALDTIKNAKYSIITEKNLKGLIKKNKINNKSVIILIDDFLGTGNSTIDYYSHAIKKQFIAKNLEPSVYIYSIAAMEAGMELIKSKIPEAEVRSWYPPMKKAFSSTSSPLGYRKSMVKIRDMCYKHGKNRNLCSRYDRKTKKDIIEPLGYENSQALVVFPYGTPNNSLPVIWSSRNNWYPIFPRITNEKINTSKDFRKETAYVLSRARIVGYDAFSTGIGKRGSGREFLFTTQVDFQLFLLTRLLRYKRPTPIICQVLGISSQDYNMLIQKAIEKGLLKENKVDLTDDGLKAYQEVMNNIKNYKTYLNRSKVEDKTQNTLYLPTSFRGKT